jgi:hypothetical protein
VQSFPVVPGDNARAAVYRDVSPERSTPLLSELQLESVAAIKASQARAASDPSLNGANAKVRRP